MQRITLLIRFFAETAIAVAIALAFGRTLISYLFYYVWQRDYGWAIDAGFFTLLALLVWIIACAIALYEKYTATKFRKILIFITAGWMVAIFIISVHSFTSFYNPHVFTFLYRLQQANASVTIEELTDFSWEKLCFLRPYSSVEELREQLGSQYVINDVDTNNERYYIIFLLPDKHSLAVSAPRNSFDSGKCLDYQEARFLTLY